MRMNRDFPHAVIEVGMFLNLPSANQGTRKANEIMYHESKGQETVEGDDLSPAPSQDLAVGTAVKVKRR